MTTQEDLLWRRSKVLELLAKGLNQSQVANEMHLPRQTISDDVKVLREESKERIRTHLEERLPLAFETCLTTLESSKKQAYDILNKTEDPRLKLQAVQIINDTTMKIMDLLTHNGTVESAMSYAERMNKKLDSIGAADARAVEESEEKKEEEEEDKERQIV
jgi:hypothetical protein